MKFTCPRCGRQSEIEEDVGDFPVRCHRCATLLRRKHATRLNGHRDSTPSSSDPLLAALTTPGTTSRAGTLRRGMLADMLAAPISSDEDEPRVIHAHSLPASDEEPGTGKTHPLLTRETRREVRHALARQQRLRRAMLEGSRRALGALSWVGLGLVLLLSLGAVLLRVHGAW
jgi:hypothetical protein